MWRAPRIHPPDGAAAAAVVMSAGAAHRVLVHHDRIGGGGELNAGLVRGVSIYQVADDASRPSAAKPNAITSVAIVNRVASDNAIAIDTVRTAIIQHVIADRAAIAGNAGVNAIHHLIAADRRI